jgi:AcrR family transcriptional regulator
VTARRVVPPRYSSQLIAERRQRILHETKRLIGECGINGFKLRDLGLRAAVSVTTIYNIFGDKEGVIAHALRDFHVGIKLDLPNRSLQVDGFLRAIAHTTAIVIENRAYALALADLYFSRSLVPAVFDLIRCMPLQVFDHFYSLAAREGRLLKGIDQNFAATSFANLEWASIKDWGAGRLTDADLVAARQRSFVLALLGISGDALRVAAVPALVRLCRLRALPGAHRLKVKPDVL